MAKARGNGRGRVRRKSPGEQLTGFMYNIAVSLAAMVCVMSYMSGAGVQGAMLRGLAMLLGCTLLACLANMGLWLVQVKDAPLMAGPEAALAGAAARPGREIEVQAKHVEPLGLAAPSQPSSDGR